MIYGTKLYELKNRPKFTNKYIASIINISDSLYSRYEKEKQIIPIKHLNALCNYFDCSLDYIFEFTDTKKYQNMKEAINKEISGRRLREIRKELNIKQYELANQLNVDNSMLSKYELGKYIIATTYLYQICKTYNISADYLLGKTDSPKYLK